MRKTKSRSGALAVPSLPRQEANPKTSTQEGNQISTQNLELELRASGLALESKLQENTRLKQQREALIRHLDIGVIMTTSTGLISTVNDSAAKMLNKTRHQLSGLPLDRVWTASGLPSVPCSAIRHQDRFLTCHDHEIGPANGRGHEIIRVIKDVTMLMNLQGQLASQQRLSVMGEMIGTIAHEIRNPLGSIELFSSLLGTSIQDDDERQALAKHIATVVRGLDQVLSNLLMMTKNLTPNILPVNAQGLVHDVIMMAMHAIRERSISVCENLDSSLREVRVDEPLLKQALLNLLLNAIQASPENGMVEISSRWASLDDDSSDFPGKRMSVNAREAFVLSVRDYGGGIFQEDQERIFEPFFSKRQGGTGLGLAIVRQVMDVHQGWVECASTLGRGTTITLWIPQGRQR